MASDLSELQAVDENSISENCRTRYNNDEIYTSCGRLLIALNPYKQLPIYGSDAIGRYHSSLDRTALPPHIYAVAAAAYHGMVKEGRSQSVVISGESGAGKTETAKLFLEFMANVGKGAGSLHQKVLQTNPVMEAFGNAQTALNDNSSRFGKFLRLEFTTSGKMCGASLKTYLLEKTRITTQAAGEQNYHVFYHLAAGAPAALRQQIGIAKPTGWRCMQGGEPGSKGHDSQTHEQMFSRVASALETLGLSAEHAAGVWAVVAAVLHACELQFAPADSSDGSPACTLTNGSELAIACRQLGLEAAQAEEALTMRKIKVGAEVIPKPNTPAEAEQVRDALAKALFSMLFDWLVRQINGSLKATSDAAAALARETQHGGAAGGGKGGGADMTAARFIGAVDVFGFESFPSNSLEQLCINFANERLQRLFVQAIFESASVIYAKEGIQVPDIPFTDNAAVVALIDGPAGEPGILQILSEECVLGNSSDESFLGRVVQRFSVDKPSTAFARAKGNRAGAFAIRHFAAEVTYEVAGFVAKNKDPLPVDLGMLLKFSKSELVVELFNPPAPVDESAAAGAAGKGKAPRQFKSAKFVGVIDGFRTSLAELVRTLEGTHTHFVRCIKPNLQKAAGSYDPEVSIRQLRTSGVVQAVHAARAGFPDHVPFDTIAHSYALLQPGYKPGGAVPGGKAGAEAALRGAGLRPEQYRLGKTLAFLAVGALDALEAGRSAQLAKRAVYLQARIRTALARRLLRQLRDQKAREAAEAERQRVLAANARAAEEEARRVAEEAERQAREAEEAQREEQEASKKQAKFNIARQKSFERATMRKGREAGAAGADDAAAEAAEALAAGGGGGPAKAVVTDVGWKEPSSAEAVGMEEAAALAAAAEYGFTNPVPDVLEYAEYLGMDVQKDQALLWIADEALSAPEPHGWEQRVDPGGNVFYFHENTGMILPEHPLDHHYQNLYLQMRDAARAEAAEEAAGSPATTGAGDDSAPSEAGTPSSARGGGGGFSAEVPSLPIDLSSLPASVLISESTKKKASLKELWGAATSRKSSRTHFLEIVTFELSVKVKRRDRGLGVGLTVDNIVVELDPEGSFAQTGGMLLPNDKIVKIDGELLGSRMLKDVVKPKPEHIVTVLFSREATQPPKPREASATRAKGASTKLRLKEYTLKLKRTNGSLGFTVDPTNVIIQVDPKSDAADLLKPGDKVVMIDGKLLELVRLSEVADTHKAQHLLKVVRIKPPKGAKPPSGPGMAAAGVKGGPAAGRKQQPGRIKFREVTLRKTAPEDRIGVLFHRSENEFDMRAFGKFEDGARPIIKKVDPDTVGARAGLQAGDVVLAVNGISGQTNYQVVEMIRTLHGEITFLVAPAPKSRGLPLPGGAF